MTHALPDEHFFRHAFARLVAMLTRRVGLRHLPAVEDAAQAALLAAAETWPLRGLPERAEAWLYRAAYNHLLDELRRQARRDALLDAHHEDAQGTEGNNAGLAGEVHDDLLRMLFACCDPAIPLDSQVVFALRTLCGFDVREIAARLYTSEANVYQRLTRARACLRERSQAALPLLYGRFEEALPGVHAVLYQLFTEGHLASHSEWAMRRELCDEAIRLTEILADHPSGGTPTTCALLALMHLHVARMHARQPAGGEMLLLDQQDRGLWDANEIARGLVWLGRSADGSVFSRYHAEAGVAAEHCLAPSFAATNWQRIVACYALLEEHAPAPVHAMNRALATAEWQGPAAGLAVLDTIVPTPGLTASHAWHAVRADLHTRCGQVEQGAMHRASALQLAPSDAIRQALLQRFRALDRADEVTDRSHAR